jgi:protein TonB
MGICLIPILFAITLRSSLVPMPGALPVFLEPFFLQIETPPRGYGDSPRPARVSRMHMTEPMSAKLLLKKVEPEFPPDARAAGIEGDVVFRIVIGRNGRVEEIHLRRGKPVLIEAAAKAVSKWQYETCVFNGNPTEVETFATVRFRLSNKHQ